MRHAVTRTRTSRARTALLLAAVIGAGGLSACGGVGLGAGDAPPLTPLSRYSLQVEPGLDRIALAVRGDGLSAAQEAAVQDLVGRWRAAGYGPLVIQAPDGNDAAALNTAWNIHAALLALGAPESQVRMTAYAGPDVRAPVLVGFETVRAHVPNCAAEQGPRGGRTSNQSSLGLGCAVTANMAAQIANPRDIIQPRDMPPAETGRAATVFANYRQGGRTSAAQEELVDGRISRAVE